MKSRLFKTKSVFISWLVSYMAILLIPILVSIAIFFESGKVIGEEINRANAAVLKQVQQDMDNRMMDIDRLYKDILSNEKIKGLMYVRYPLSPIYQFNIGQLTRKELIAYSAAGSFINNFYIYFNRGDFALAPGAKYNSEVIYEIFHGNSSLTYSQWSELMGRKNYKNTISIVTDNGDRENSRSIFYLYSLSLEYVEPEAVLVVEINEHQVRELVENVQWIKESKFFISDHNNGIIASNSTDELLEQIGYGRLDKSSGLIYENINGRKMVISYVSSKVMDWKYVSVIPESVFMEKASYIRDITIYSLLFCVLAGGIVAYFFARKNYNSLAELIKVFKGQNRMTGRKSNNEYQFIKDAIHHTLEEKEKMNQRLEQQKAVIRSSLISRLLRGRISGQTPLEEVLSLNDIRFYSDEFAVILFNIEGYSERFSDTGNSNESDKLQAVRNIVEKLGDQNEQGFIVEIDEMMACLVNFRETGRPDTLHKLERIAAEANKFINEYLRIHMTIAISNIHSTYHGICQAYREALEAMEYRLVAGTREIIKYSEISSSGREYVYSLEKEIQLINQIKAGDFGKANKMLNDIFNGSFLEERLSVELTKCLMFDLVSTMIKTIDEIEGSTGNKGDLWKSVNPVKSLINCETVMEMKIKLEGVLRHVCEYIGGQRKSHNTRLRDDIIRFIKCNYTDVNLCIVMIAEKFGRNTDYISRFFKEQTGEGILDYINKIRIENTKHLLKEQNININDVAVKSGYINSAALIRAFNKYEGITPGKYKIMNSN